MDKANPQLDPKLKEAYDRVMGTVVNPVKTSEPTNLTQSQPVQTTPPAMQAPQPVTAQPVTTTVQSPIVGKAKEKKKGVSPLIIGLGIIVFLVVYAIVWIKFFGLTVPFLNP